MELMAHEVMPRVNQALGLGYQTNVEAPALTLPQELVAA
jgi:hypothetical protein